MDAISSAATANAIQAVNDILKYAATESIDAAKKNLKAEVEVKVSGTKVDGYA